MSIFKVGDWVTVNNPQSANHGRKMRIREFYKGYYDYAVPQAATTIGTTTATQSITNGIVYDTFLAVGDDGSCYCGTASEFLPYHNTAFVLCHKPVVRRPPPKVPAKAYRRKRKKLSSESLTLFAMQ